MFGDLSSLNSVNEIYHSEDELTQARETVKLAKVLFFDVAEDEITKLPKFEETLFVPDQFVSGPQMPCSEDTYFLFMDKLLEEKTLQENNKDSRIYICPEIEKYGKKLEYGEIEIINYVQTYLDDVFWTRHSFVMPNKQVLELRRIVMEANKNRSILD